MAGLERHAKGCRYRQFEARKERGEMVTRAPSCTCGAGHVIRERTHLQWWRTVCGDLLHYLPVVDRDKTFYRRVVNGSGSAKAVSLCGRRARYWPPGTFSRLGAKRCDRCCAALSVPSGFGTPLNSFWGGKQPVAR